MAVWKETLDLSDVWYSKEWDDKNVQELGILIAKRIRSLKTFDPEDWTFCVDCVERFENIYPYEEFLTDSDDVDGAPFTPIEDFNEAMRGLYDWADYNRVWIKRNF